MHFCYQYVQYSKLKRIIKRNKFIADRDEASADAESNINSRKGSSPALANSQSALNRNTYGDYYSLLQTVQSNTLNSDGPIVLQPDDESDFFKVILSEMEKVNKFFVG
jgi:SPX domain protein involved in polyphosphate accumulation